MPDLALRVGVVTGEVAVTVGATNQGMVAGDPVNTAARIQSAASGGQVLVDETTRSLTAAAIAYDDAGEHRLKGKAEPVRLWRAVTVVADVGGEQRIDGLEAPLSGRDTEVRLLKDLFHGCADSRRPRLVVVDGEPGSGKSRLAWEFEKYVDGLAADIAWHRGRCLSYGDGVAFRALADAVRSRLGLTELDPPTVVAAALQERLPEWVRDGEERDWIRARLAVLLGVDEGRQFPREDLFTAWAAFLERVGGDDSVVLVIDDAEHADDGLLDFLDHLMDTSGSAVFVLVQARPELLRRRPELGGRRATVVRLDPLSGEAMAALVDGLVAGLPPEVRAHLVSLSDGVPLFAVETVRALIDRDAVVPREGRYVAADDVGDQLASVETPASLQALIAARLDTLTADERRVVDDAAVLGLTFTADGLRSLTPDALDVEAVLSQLRRKEIVEVITDRYSSELGQYRFRHGLIRQVAYAEQSRRDRKRRHLAVADTLSGQEDPAGDLAAVIAQHLLDALHASGSDDGDVGGLSERAREELERAAERARALGAMNDALRLAEAALARADRPVDRARLLLAAARDAYGSGDLEVGEGYAKEAIVAFEGLGDADGAAFAAAGLARIRTLVLDNDGAVAIGEAHWSASPERPISAAARLALAQVLASAHLGIADFEACGRYCDHALLLAEATEDMSELARALITSAARLERLGAPVTATAQLHTAADLARRHSAYRDLARAMNNLASLQLSFDVTAALDSLAEGAEAVARAGLASMRDANAGNRALALWLAGRLPECADVVAAVGRTAVDLGFRLLVNTVAVWQAEAAGAPLPPASPLDVDATDESARAWGAAEEMARHLHDGAMPAAVAAADDCFQHQLLGAGLAEDFPALWPAIMRTALAADDLERAQRYLAPVVTAEAGALSPLVRAEFHHHRGLVAAATGGDPDSVEADLRDAIAGYERYRAAGFAARAREDLGQWLNAVGRVTEAAVHLDRARDDYVRIGAFGWLAQMDARLSERRPRPPSTSRSTAPHHASR